MLFLDIKATVSKIKPNIKILKDIANECFMPLSYGGGITTLDDVKSIFDIGFEKIAINSFLYNKPIFLDQIASIYGSQAIIAFYGC